MRNLNSSTNALIWWLLLGKSWELGRKQGVAEEGGQWDVLLKGTPYPWPFLSAFASCLPRSEQLFCPHAFLP